MCIETGEIFDTIIKAAEKYNIKATHITRVCKGKRKSTGGYHWQYVDTWQYRAKPIKTPQGVFFIGRCNDYLAREYRKSEILLWEVPNIRKDEDIVYSPNKYRETEGM